MCPLEKDKAPRVMKVKALKRRHARDSEAEAFDPVIKRLFPTPCNEEDSCAIDRATDGVPMSQTDAKEDFTEEEEEKVCDCRALWPNFEEFQEAKPHERLSSYLQLEIQPEDLAIPGKIRSSMNSSIRVLMYTVIDYVFKETLFLQCEGCVWILGTRWSIHAFYGIKFTPTKF